MNDNLLRWLWGAAQLGLMILIAFGGLAAAALAAGAADPTRAGPLQAVSQARVRLPAAPFTLEADCALPPDADPLAAWELRFEGQSGEGVYSVWISADGYLRLPPFQPDSVGFHHIRPPGQPNRIAVTVYESGAAEVRINHEWAWHGRVSPAHSARLFGCKGQLALYASARSRQE